MIRHAAVAGYFYEGSAAGLAKQIESFLVPAAKRISAIGVMCPHAGLVYSGGVAGAVYSTIEPPDVAVLIGPNHTGLGTAVSVMREGAWETPSGTVQIEESLAGSILAGAAHAREDTLAHLREHSLEVQLPFLLHFNPKVKIVPIQMLDTSMKTCVELGAAVAKALRERQAKPENKGSRVLIVASSDMSHYEPAATAKEKDFKAIQAVLDLDPERLYHTVREHGITMCGYGPTVAMLVAAKALGAKEATLVKYANSGDVSGDINQVVGYAGIVVK